MKSDYQETKSSLIFFVSSLCESSQKNYAANLCETVCDTANKMKLNKLENYSKSLKSEKFRLP